MTQVNFSNITCLFQMNDMGSWKTFVENINFLEFEQLLHFKGQGKINVRGVCGGF